MKPAVRTSAPRIDGSFFVNPDLRLRRHRPVHRAAVRDLHQALALGPVEVAFERELALDLVEQARFGPRPVPRGSACGPVTRSACPGCGATAC